MFFFLFLLPWIRFTFSHFLYVRWLTVEASSFFVKNNSLLLKLHFLNLFWRHCQHLWHADARGACAFVAGILARTSRMSIFKWFPYFPFMPPSRLLKSYTSFSAFSNDMITNTMLRPNTQAGKKPWGLFIITLFKAVACSVQRSKEKKRKWRTIFTLFTLIKSTHLHEHICHLCMVLLRLERRKACPRRVFYTTCTSYECLAHCVNPTYYRSLRLSDSYISAWRYASCCRIAKKGTSAPPYPARGAGFLFYYVFLSRGPRAQRAEFFLLWKIHA